MASCWLECRHCVREVVIHVSAFRGHRNVVLVFYGERPGTLLQALHTDIRRPDDEVQAETAVVIATLELGFHNLEPVFRVLLAVAWIFAVDDPAQRETPASVIAVAITGRNRPQESQLQKTE